MKSRRTAWIAALLAAAAMALATAIVVARSDGDDRTSEDHVALPVLSVTVTRPERALLPVRIPANGHVVAWQEASVAVEVDGLRLVEIGADVGDTVERGALLARFDADLIEAELAEARAAVAQARADVEQAGANARRARNLDRSGALSGQQIEQYLIAEKTAAARLDAALAAEQRQRLRLARTRVLAPDDGVITSRTATVGSVGVAGDELFRLIRDGRLEWRADVAMRDLERVRPGQHATLHAHGHAAVTGTLRVIAPTIDADTHDGLVHVDLPAHGTLRAGSFARGEIHVGDAEALTLPERAVLLRDGFSYVMQVADDSTVVQRKVEVGRRIGERVEIVAGLAQDQPVIASGLGFLGDGDAVRVVDETDDDNASADHAVTSRPDADGQRS